MRFQKFRIPMAAASILVFGICVALTQRQASTWKDSITLYERSIAAGEDNAPIRYLLAVAFQAARYPEEVVAAQFRRAIEIKPDYVNAYTQLAMIALNRQDFAEGERLVMETIRLESRNPAYPKNLGVLRNMQGKPEEAAALFREALRLDPDYIEANHELAWMHLKQDHLTAAARELEIVARASPWDYAEQCELGVVYLRLGRREEARRCFERALWINPKYAEAERNLRLLVDASP